MQKYTIKENPEFNSLEISFDGKPSDTIRDALKTLRFRWHSVKKVWYGYADKETARKAIENAEMETPTKIKHEKANKYGVQVGDIFSASWGYEQTNVDFFQVVALVGESSVRVREVYPEMIAEDCVSPMSSDRTYKISREILPPASRSVFIKDQERGDLKRIKPGYYKDPEKAKENCFFTLSSFASAYKCSGATEKVYESWYA